MTQTEHTKSHGSGWWKGALKYGLAVALLVFMVSMNWTELNKLVRQPPDFAYFAFVALIFVTCTAIQYFRWYLLVRALDLPFAFRNAVRLGLVGTFYNTFLPGSVGGDFVKAFFIAKGHPERKAAAIATVVADRMVGLFGLILFAAAVGGFFWATGNEKIVANTKLQTIILVCIGLAVTAIVGYVGLGLFSQQWSDRLKARLHDVRKVGPTLAELWFTIWTYRQRSGTVLAVVAMSAVVHLGFVLMYHLAVRVFPPENLALLGTLPEHFVIAPIGFIVQAAVPFPGGLGIGEFTFGGLYQLLGPAGEPELISDQRKAIGLAGRLTLRVIEWTVGLIGYIAFLRMKDVLPVEEAEAAEEAEDPYDGEAVDKAAVKEA